MVFDAVPDGRRYGIFAATTFAVIGVGLLISVAWVTASRNSVQRPPLLLRAPPPPPPLPPPGSSNSSARSRARRCVLRTCGASCDPERGSGPSCGPACCRYLRRLPRVTSATCSKRMRSRNHKLYRMWHGAWPFPSQLYGRPACWEQSGAGWFDRVVSGADCHRDWGPNLDAPSLLGFDRDMLRFCSEIVGGRAGDLWKRRETSGREVRAACMQAQLNLLRISNWTTCSNVQWLLCVVQGKASWMRGSRQLLFATAPRDLRWMQFEQRPRQASESDVYFFEVCLLNELCSNSETLMRIGAGDPFYCQYDHLKWMRAKRDLLGLTPPSPPPLGLVARSNLSLEHEHLLQQLDLNGSYSKQLYGREGMVPATHSLQIIWLGMLPALQSALVGLGGMCKADRTTLQGSSFLPAVPVGSLYMPHSRMASPCTSLWHKLPARRANEPVPPHSWVEVTHCPSPWCRGLKARGQAGRRAPPGGIIAHLR